MTKDPSEPDSTKALHTFVDEAGASTLFEPRHGKIFVGTPGCSNPETTVCLQAVDYFLWVLQRFYEQRRHPVTGAEQPHEDRYLNLLWPQMVEIHDLDHGHGTFYGPDRPLTVAERFSDPSEEVRKP